MRELMHPDLTGLVLERFRRQFSRGDFPRVFFAPGRVNLMGDHIDYCGGTVMPMPVQFGTWLAVAPNHTGRIRAYSWNEGEAVDLDPLQLGTYPPGHWGRFVVGATTLANRHLGTLRGCDIYIHGNLPSSGLSSSASLATGLLFGLLEPGGVVLPGIELARLAQRVEHEFVGVNCGLMDQAVITLGSPSAALLFDCATGTGEALPFARDRPAIVVVDSGVQRQLAGSGYNTRRRELEQIALLLGQPFETLARTLAEADITRLDDPVLARRARHIRSEQGRTLRAAAALAGGECEVLGQILDESHESLRRDFEVSCAGVDALVAALRATDGCFGARMTGGGFGGAVVAAFEPAAVPAAMADATTEWFVAFSAGGVQRYV